MALDPDLVRRVDPVLAEIARQLEEAATLTATVTLRLRDLEVPVPDHVPAATVSLLDNAHRIEGFRRSLPT
jgi:hypothetical protein